jgi:hypothetical protein
MKLRFFAVLTALGVAAGSFAALPVLAGPYTLLAQQKDQKKKKDGPAPQGPQGALNKDFRLAPQGLKWGLGVRGIAKLYEKVFDRQFLPLYKKAQPGVETKALDAEVEDKKRLIRRNVVEFGTLPTGIDQTPLKGEYSYNNGESMTKVTLRSGTVRHFFFFDDKLWKIYDEHKLGKGGPLGESFEDAVKVLSKKLGAPPKKLAADSKGRIFEEAAWRGREMNIRAINRGADLVGIVYSDAGIEGNLSALRKNKPAEGTALDNDVSDALRKAPEPSAAEAADKAKAEKGKKKKK